MRHRGAIRFVRIERCLSIFGAPVRPVEQRFQFSEIVGKEKPVAIVAGCERKWRNHNSVDLVPFVIDRLPSRARIFFQKFRPPFANYAFRSLLASPETEAGHKSGVALVAGSQRKECILGIDLIDFLQGLRSTVSFRKPGQRLAQKILHRGFAVKLVNVGVMPLIARSVKVRHVRNENGFAREKRGHCRI